jgi:LssY C-terminus
VPVPGLDVDYKRRPFEDLHAAGSLVDCNEAVLREHLHLQPQATTNRRATRPGDPVNLVVIADFGTILGAFGARWDETETLSLATCWKTARAFMLGSLYRYSPVSPLFLHDRSQDFALQRVRHNINQRLHLRLWQTPYRFKARQVWVGQVSRDIGVRFTTRAWNLTTHRIDPDVDEARDYVVADLLNCGHLEQLGYVEGVGACDRSAPRHNLTGDPYVTDGRRAVLALSSDQVKTRIFAWQAHGDKRAG